MSDTSEELVWFITGTSSGFGRALVDAALARGDRVVATARDLSKLSDLPRTDKLRTMQLDVTEGAASLVRKLNAAAAFFGQIDVVVNNAGVSVMAFAEEGGSETLRRQYEVNVFGLLDVTTAALPHLRAHRRGTLVHIGSRASWKSEIPGAGIYVSSKAAVRVLAETLNAELTPFGIRTLIVEPGAFRTHSYDSELERPHATADYDELADTTRAALKRMREGLRGDPAKAMALLVDVVRGEGKARGKAWPLYLPMGKTADEAVRGKAERMLRVLDEWGEIIRDLDLEDE